MADRVLFVGISFVVMSALSPFQTFSQTPPQYRIPQQIVVNGQLTSGAHVTTASGQMQSFTCPSPQPYTTADGGSQGWACYEQTTGVWLLNAVPPTPPQAPVPAPAPQPVPQQPTVVYPQTQPVVVYQTPPAVIYQPPVAVIYHEPAPTVVYAPAPRPVVIAPAYPPGVVLGRAAIDAAGRIASAAILNSRRSVNYYYYRYDDGDRRPHNRNHGRRW
jgi:hypothetical protein